MRALVYRPLGGTHIETACLHAALMAKANRCLVRFGFNGVRLVASPKKSDATLLWEWTILTDRNASNYRNSRAGKAAALEREQRFREAQNKTDILLFNLDSELKRGMDTIMEWLRLFTRATDHVGVRFDIPEVLRQFRDAGFEANAHVGQPPEAFNNRTMMGEYIIGQAMNGLERGMAPHPMTITFVDRYFQLPSDLHHGDAESTEGK